MRQFLILPFSLFLSFTLFAQKDKEIHEFGKVDKSELELKTCDFDKDAEALVLFDVGDYYCDFAASTLTTELVHHVRIKIFRDKGLSRADIRIRYAFNHNAESVKILGANTYNIDNTGNIKVTKLDKKLIYDKKIDSRYAEQVFTMPEAKAGSIIEYKYVLRGANAKDWYFQGDIPVKFSRYTIDFPREFELHTRPLCSLKYEADDKSNGLRNIKTISMKDIPALRDEPFISADGDYLQKVESWITAVILPERRINLLKTWLQVTEELMADEDFGIQMKKEIPRTSDLDADLKKLKDPYLKIAAIHNYVRKNMKWNGYNSIWAVDGVKSAWKERKGNSGEINLILVNLLKDAGLDAYAVLVSTRDNGRITMGFPNIGQFNKVMALVKTPERMYVMDGTDMYTPSTLIPAEVMYTEGLVIEKSVLSGFGWLRLWDESHKEKNTVILQAAISGKGEMKGHAYISSQDYARTKRMAVLHEGKDKYTEAFYTSANPTVLIDSMAFKNEGTDTLPFVQDLDFHMPVSGSGDYTYFSVNLFSGLGSNPFIADSRFSDVFFGTNQLYSIIANINIPEGYSFEELPKSSRMTLEDKSLVVTRMVGATASVFSIRITVEYNRPFYTSEEYPDLREFYKKLFGLLNEQYVLHKN